jgi:trigger factor
LAKTPKTTGATATEDATKPETPTGETAPEHAHDHAHDHDYDHAHEHDHPHSHAPKLNEACKREVEVNIPADFVAKETDKVLSKYQKLARIPGFRAGKVPVNIIKRRYMEEVRGEVIENLVPTYYREAVQKGGFSPVSQPHIADLAITEGEPLKFTAAFEVLPDIEVAGYKQLKAEKKDVAVADDEVQAALKELQERQSAYEHIAEERPLKDGDFAVVSLKGTAKGTQKVAEKKAEIAAEKEVAAATEAKPVELNDVLVEIGGTTTVKDFSDNLRGAQPGDEKTFDVTYPEDFSDQRLAGQVMSYEVKVQGIKKKIVPELNDDFAKELGEFPTLDDLKKRIRTQMEAERKHELEHTEKEKLIDQLVTKNEFPVPQSLIDRQVDVRLERGLRALAQQGMREQDMKRLNFQRLREGQAEAATREVRASLLLDKIAELEKIEVSEEELNKELESAASQTKQTVEAVRHRLQQDGSLDRIKDRMRNEKALDFLYRQSA